MKPGRIIGIVISLVVGGVAFFVVRSITSTMTAGLTEETSGVMGALINILPVVVVIGIILSIFRVIGGTGPGLEDDEKQIEVGIKIEKNGRKLILMLTQASNTIGEFINNLDMVLGVKTINDNKRTSSIHPLVLHDKDLYINNYAYDWYLVDKHPDEPMFKVIGLHKQDAGKNVVYIVGNNGTNPYLFQVPNKYIEDQSQNWIEMALAKI